MAKITIRRRNEAQRLDGRAPLYAVINYQRQKIRINIDVAVKAAEWDPIKQFVKGRTQDAYDKNILIADARAKITDILVRARLTGEAISPTKFNTLFHRPADTGSFIDFARRNLAVLRAGYQWETQRHHSGVIAKLEQYRPDLLIEDITPEFIRAYTVYMRDCLGNSPATVHKNICTIRVHYQAAMRAGLAKNDPFIGYKTPHLQPGIIFLTEEELNKLISLYNSAELTDEENDILRFFLWMAFTAMHYTDAKLLQIEQVFAGEIHYRRIKTRTFVNMPLSKPAQKLFEYYRGGRKKGNLIINVPTNQCFNRRIKMIAAKVGITKAVSAKAARHTFATLYYKKNNGDIGTLSKLLGHTSVTTTMIYAHITKDCRADGVAAFDDLL
jgi:site-specific recombinase XerD